LLKLSVTTPSAWRCALDAEEYFGIGQESSASDIGEADVLKRQKQQIQ